jgi:hypothetical protein
MNASSQATAVAPPPFAALIDHELLTRVSLAYVAHRFNLYLRFGEPAYHVQRDRWRRVAAFWPASIFCRIRWEANDYGTVRWQLMVMQACTSMDAAQRIPGVWPGACLLLHAEGERMVRLVLPLIDAIEALGIAPVDVSPAYWRMLSNRLAAHGPLPVYTAERHAAWLAGKALS